MSYVLGNAHWFALLIGALIFFHELGHFLVAKAFDVKVVRFSLGFGPRVLRFTRGETEYVLSLLPLGGYVKMVGESPDEIEAHEVHRALSNKPLWQRTLIVLAGPSANLLLATVIYVCMFAGTHSFGDTRLGIVTPNEPAWQAGLRPGDKIVAVSGEPVVRWEQLKERIGSHPKADIEVTYERQGQRHQAQLHLGSRQEDDPFGQSQARGKAGLSLQFVRPLVAIVDAESPAAKAGIKTDDIIVRVGQQATGAWFEVVEAVAKNPEGQPLVLTVLRGEQSQQITLFGDTPPASLRDTGLAAADGPGLHGYTGLVAKNVLVQKVESDTPAARAGIAAGDRVLALISQRPDQAPVRTSVSVWEVDLAAFGLEPDTTVKLELQRQRDRLVVPIDLHAEAHGDTLTNDNHVYALGAQNDSDTLDSYSYERFVYPAEALVEGLRQVGDDMGLIGRGVAKMIRGDIPMANMGGPIMLFVIAEKSAKRGWLAYFRAMAMTSVNLGVLNVLPIPALDGGHLLFFAAEAVLGRPPSIKLRERATLVGVGLLLLLMVIVFRNDALRFVWGRG